jgi:hypothetical protein
VKQTLARSPTLATLGVFLAVASCTLPARAQPQPPPDADVEIPAAPKPPAAAPLVPAPPPPAAAAPAAPSPAPAAPTRPQASAEVEALRAEVREERAKLGARIDALEAELAARKAGGVDQPDAHEGGRYTDGPWVPPIGGPLPGKGSWGLGAYVQGQYEQHENSSDQISQTGSYLNQDRFLVRRGRLRFDAAYQWCELALEIDGNTQSTPTVSPKRINASLVWRGRPWNGDLEARSPRSYDVPLMRFTLGLTGIPFGFELADSPRDRVFLERSTASQSLFPGEQDLGALLTGGVGFFRYSVAAMNGDPLGDSSSNPVGDPTHAKDIIARLGFDARAGAGERLAITGGVSALYGTGFHAGTPATKPSVTWVDSNQNGVIDANELVGVPAMAAAPSQSFARWAFNVDLQARLRTPIGLSMLYGEITVASDLDRGLFIADPVKNGVDLRELGGYVAFVQEIARYGLVGFRFDYYDPNADFLRSSGGQQLPVSQAISTYSPLVGVQLPDRARLVFEYDVVRNLLGIGSNGVPTNLPEDHFALRLQVQL